MSAAQRRAGWLIADQAVSSISNFAVAIVIARESSLEDFGAYTVGAALYLLTIELVRPLSLDPLLVRYSGAEDARIRRAFAGASGMALLLGLLVGGAAALVGLLVGGPVSAILLAMGAAMPGLLSQDACRYALMAAGRASATALNDVLWTTLQLAGFAALLVAGVSDAWAFVAVWGGAAAIAALVGFLQLHALPSLRGAVRWAREHRDVTPHYVFEYAVDAGAFQATLVAVGVVAGLGGLAALNGARVLLGPLNVLFISAMSIVVSEGSRLREAADARVVWLVRGAGAALATLAIGWSVVLTLIPVSVGEAILGDSFEEARGALIGFGLFWAARGSIIASRSGFRIAQLAKRAARTMATLAPIAIVTGVAGALIGGAEGAGYGLALGNVVAAAVWALRFERIRDEASGTARATPEPVA